MDQYEDFIWDKLKEMSVDEQIKVVNKYPEDRIGKIYYNHEHFVDNFCKSEKQIDETYDLEAYNTKDPFVYAECDYLPISIDRDELDMLAYRIIDKLVEDGWMLKEFKEMEK